MSDLIDRETAIYEILRLTSYDTVRSLYEATVADKYDDYKDGIMDAIDAVIGVDSRPKAKNVYYEETDHCEFKCSICGATIGVVEGGALDGANFKFCPWCGAELDGEVRLWDD